jgi:hypothetical protein
LHHLYLIQDSAFSRSLQSIGEFGLNPATHSGIEMGTRAGEFGESAVYFFYSLHSLWQVAIFAAIVGENKTVKIRGSKHK